MSDTLQNAYAAYLAERAADVATLRPLLLKALSAAKVALVEIDYDGYGDSGQVESIHAADSQGRAINLRDQPCRNGALEEYSFTTLEEALDSFAWSLVGLHHDGFENGEGGSGAISIDVANGKINLDHNQRFIDYTNTELEV